MTIPRWFWWMLILPLGLVLLPGCAHLDVSESSMSAGTYSRLDHSPVEIPLELREGRIFVKARINDSEPRWFILDSGAAMCSLRRDRAEALKLKRRGKVKLQGIAGKEVQPMYEGATFDLAGASLSPKKIAGSSQVPAEGKEEGCLGFPVFSQFVVEINYQARTLKLHDPKNYRYTGAGEVLPLQCRGEQATLQTQLAGLGQTRVQARLLLDTGCNGSLCLSKEFVEAHKLAEAAGKTAAGARGGVGGKMKTKVGRLGSLQMGRFQLDKPVANFFQQRSSVMDVKSGQAGHMGNEILRRFTVIFDVRQQRLILETNAAFAEPFVPQVSMPLLIADGRDCVVIINGAVVVGEGLDPEIFKVTKVVEKSPAAEAGLREGDIIVAVDGKPVAELTIEQLLQLARQEERIHVLKIQRGRQALEVRIRSRLPL